MNPKISIITITFNSEKTVRATFESIRKQLSDDLEYIVIDGGSTDSTLEIIEENKDIIKKIISEPDKGISDAMNKGIKIATGEIIGIIHSDDMLADDALSIIQRNYRESIDVYYGNALMCTENGRSIHTLKPVTDLSKFKYEFCLIHPSTFITKNAYLRYGLYDETLKCSMDYDLLLRFYNSGCNFNYIDKTLSVIRMGGTNQRLRKQTLREMYNISVKYGGSPIVAGVKKISKEIKDVLRPIAKMVGYKNKRVQ